MKLRPIQLVCFALLLATLRLADPAAFGPGEVALRTACFQVLGSPQSSESRTSVQPRAARTIPCPIQPASAMSGIATQSPLPTTPRAVWTMSPPRSHSAALQSVTGFGRLA